MGVVEPNKAQGPSAQELTAFVRGRGRRRMWAVVAATVVALAGVTAAVGAWPEACETYTQSVCHAQGQSDHCVALTALAKESLQPKLCAEASATLEDIEAMQTEQVAAYTGIVPETDRGWAKSRLVLKYRVAQLVMRGKWPRQALQGRQAFERALSAD